MRSVVGWPQPTWHVESRHLQTDADTQTHPIQQRSESHRRSSLCPACSSWMSRARSMCSPRQTCRWATRLIDSLVVATAPGPIRSSSGVRVMPDQGDRPRSRRNRSTLLLIAGCPNAAEVPPKSERRRVAATSSAERRGASARCAAALSSCAAAGLLDGRRVTTHWAVATQLACGGSRTSSWMRTRSR